MQFVKYQALGNKIVIDFDGDIDRLEGKWKLNQNHPLERREQIMRGLRDRPAQRTANRRTDGRNSTRGRS